MPNTHLRRHTIAAYVPQDQEFLPDLEEALEALRCKNLLTTWLTRNVENEDPAHNADILLLLISPDFIESPYFLRAEIDLLNMNKDSSLCVIPILLRDTLWYQHPLAVIPTLPPDIFGGVQPLAEWKNRNIALNRIRDGIIPIVEAFEREQLNQQSLLLQEIIVHIAQNLNEMIEQGLPEHLFELCERLSPVRPETIAHIFDQLADVTREKKPDLSNRCSQRATALRQAPHLVSGDS